MINYPGGITWVITIELVQVGISLLQDKCVLHLTVKKCTVIVHS